ncbi:hypothetical protein C7N43_36175 [Sphingobacteriales bacterium UPWRP_1]|nr:hypothetical protein B6N25_01365 [Sphingobacteriales bacterium TSM_CSS]PSJ72056.1 hypothetical protein C7N43_36175 [Sphingobacteriales bacterium UPWRP_1]
MDAFDTIFIRGTVVDAKTGEPIQGANVYLKSDRTNSAFSNVHGYFSLSVEPLQLNDILVVTAAGYERFTDPVTLNHNLNLQSELFKRRESKDDRSESDVQLVQNALAGDQRAYGRLMARYRDSIYFIIQKMVNNREDTDDLTMEAFGKAFQNLHKYSTDYAFSTWLYRIAINNCIDFIRKKRIETLSLDEETNDEEGNSTTKDYESDMPDPEESYIKKQRILRIRSVIDRLNPKYRRLIELRHLEEKSYEEIAEEMDLPLGTVKAQLFRAKELLLNIMNNTKERY